MRSSSSVSGTERSIGIAQNKISAGDGGDCRGQLDIVGIGTGSIGVISRHAIDALASAKVVVAHDTYIDLLSLVQDGRMIIPRGYGI